MRCSRYKSDPWEQVVDVLSGAMKPDRTDERNCNLLRHSRRPKFIRGAPTVTAIPSSLTILAEYRHPSRGCLNEVLWREGRADRADFCALSGESIRRGDRVYKPDGRRSTFLSGSMILVSFVQKNFVVETCPSFT